VARLLPLVWRNLWRSRRRTVLTLGSMAIPFFLLMVLQTAVDSMDRWRAWSDRNLRFAVYHRSGLSMNIPEAHVAKLARLPGVVAVTPYTGYGGIWRGHDQNVPATAIDSRTWRAVWKEGAISDAEYHRFERERTGAIVEARQAERYGWKVGDTVALAGVRRPVDLTFTICGLLHDFPDPNAFFFHREYMEEATGRPGECTLIWVVAPDSASMPGLERAAEALFANSAHEVKAELEKGFVERIIYSQGNISGVIGGLGTAVVCVVVLMAANALAISVRERVTEIAVMKAIGFTRGKILALILVESALLGFAGGLAGCALGYAVFSCPAALKLLDPFNGARYVSTAWAAWAAAKWTWIAPLVGIGAGAIPAISACRLPVATTLRRLN